MELDIGDPAVDRLHSDDPFTPPTSMLLEQLVTLASALAGPKITKRRVASSVGWRASSPVPRDRQTRGSRPPSGPAVSDP